MSKVNTDSSVADEIIQNMSETLKLNKKGLKLERFYTQDGRPPFEEIKWEHRTASITNEKGEVIFEQKDIARRADVQHIAKQLELLCSPSSGQMFPWA